MSAVVELDVRDDLAAFCADDVIDPLVGNPVLLKGALLFDLWFDQPHRPARHIDLLGFGPSDIEHLIEVFQQVCMMPSDDGILFDHAGVRAAPNRKEANYEDLRSMTRLSRL